MTTNQLIVYCLKKNGAYIDYPFGSDFTVVKVEKRIFAQFFQLKGQAHITLNCDMMTGQFYRQMFPGIVVRGYHCPPFQQTYYNTIPQNGSIPSEMIFEMIEHSYTTVVGKLPKYLQKKLQNSGA